MACCQGVPGRHPGGLHYLEFCRQRLQYRCSEDVWTISPHALQFHRGGACLRLPVAFACLCVARSQATQAGAAHRQAEYTEKALDASWAGFQPPLPSES